jgi:hypothetical protein
MNSDATEMLPIRLVISITIIAAIIVLVGVASESLRVSLAESQVEHECRMVLSSLSTVVASGVARDIEDSSATKGSQRILTMTLPDSLLYVSFGGNPDATGAGELNPTLTEDGAAIFYRVQGGSAQVIWLPRDTTKFREGAWRDSRWVINGSEKSFIIHHGGKIELVFELVEKNHENYILIHADDGIE